MLFGVHTANARHRDGKLFNFALHFDSWLWQTHTHTHTRKLAFSAGEPKKPHTLARKNANTHTHKHTRNQGRSSEMLLLGLVRRSVVAVVVGVTLIIIIVSLLFSWSKLASRYWYQKLYRPKYVTIHISIWWQHTISRKYSADTFNTEPVRARYYSLEFKFIFSASEF